MASHSYDLESMGIIGLMQDNAEVLGKVGPRTIEYCFGGADKKH